MVKYILLISTLFTINLSAGYSQYQEMKQNQKVKSLYSKAREIAMELENKLKQKIAENKQLKEQMKELRERNLKLQKRLEKYNIDMNSSKKGDANE